MFDNPLKYKYCEGANLNAFVYKALVNSTVPGEALGKTRRIDIYREAATQLAQSLNESFWTEKQGFYSSAILDFKPAGTSVHASMLALNRGLVPMGWKRGEDFPVVLTLPPGTSATLRLPGHPIAIGWQARFNVGFRSICGYTDTIRNAHRSGEHASIDWQFSVSQFTSQVCPT